MATQIKERFEATNFNPQCPGCRYILSGSPQSCPKCQLSLDALNHVFQYAPPPVEPLSDPHQILSKNERLSITRNLAKFSSRFPENPLRIYLLKLAPEISLQQFSFWLHNTIDDSEISPGQQTLLLADAQNNRATLSLGYGLEAYIWLNQVESGLTALTEFMFHNKHKKGLSDFIKCYRRTLGQSWKICKRQS